MREQARTRAKTMLIGAILGMLCAAAPAARGDDLSAGFASPPDTAKPRTWWHWVSGNASKEGITADLEAMRRIGLGGAQIFSVNQGPKGPVVYMSDEWRGLVKHAVSEAERLGLELTIHDCEGWSESGGPWITPPLAMQKVVWSETRVHGPGNVTVALPQPPTVKGYYRDVEVLAFPSLAGEEHSLAELKPKVTSGGAEVDGAKLFDGDPKTTVTLPPPADGGGARELVIEFGKPLPCASFTIAPVPANTKVELQASDDGRDYRPLGAVDADRRARGEATITFKQTAAKSFRILASSTTGSAGKPLAIGEVRFGAARLPDYVAASGLAVKVFGDGIAPVDVPAEMSVRPEQQVDLTSKMDASGNLTWDAPAGDWTVVRLGATDTGTPNHPAMPQTVGLECDKLNPEAVTANFNGELAKVIADSGIPHGDAKDPLTGAGLKLALMDSWEAGCQNWTPRFFDEFKSRRGYDARPWMVTMTGRIVQSPEATQRFLWDYRRTIADLLTEHHYGLTRSLLHDHGMGLEAEAPGIGMPTIADEIQCKGRTDVPMGEFWIDGHNDSKEPACAAHVYGKTYVAAEAFTAATKDASWTNDPFSCKALGDLQFCRGVNRFVFHRYAHQPWLDRKPGMTMGPWGLNFERTNTWWEQASAWMSYLSRSQYLLQRGLFVGDICYFYGDGAPVTLREGDLKPAPPKGYDYDAIDAEALLTRTSVKDGRLTLADGMSYRVLVLPDVDRMRPEILRKVRELVDAGATVVGPRPVGSPSLSGYPQCDDEVKQIAGQVWGDCDGRTVTEHASGKGRVVWGKPLADVLADAGPDFVASGERKDANVLYIHRKDGDADVYFVSNQKPRYEDVDCTFRVGGKSPELWHPDTGIIEPAAVYTVKEGRTTVPLRLEPAGSVFVVFRAAAAAAAAAADPVVSVTKDGRDATAFGAAGTVAPASKLEIRKAEYGVLNGAPEKVMDLTSKLAELAKDGSINVTVDNDLASRDPAYLEVKQLRVEYVLDGVPGTTTADEGTELRIPSSPSPGDMLPAAALNASPDDARLALTAWEPGDYAVTTASGATRKVEVGPIAAPVEVGGAWTVRFPPNLGAPEQATFDTLESWSKNADPGVKYFSGTATYAKSFDLPADALGDGRRLYLSLGRVKNLAEVTLNGKSLGILWKPPFRVEITDAAKPGANQLEVKVTNLWPNRLIGDQSLPEEKRVTWSAFNPYKKDSPLLESGLIGPVTVVTAKKVEIGK